MRSRVFLTGALALVPLASAAQVPSDTLFRAMRDELSRSMAELRLDTLAGPYFIAYRIDDVGTAHVAATRGGLVRSDESRHRRFTVEVRVGAYNFDNSNFFAMSGGMIGMRRLGGEDELPLDDDYRELRRHLWLATDEAYKQALEQLSRKRATLANRTLGEEVPDFAHAEPALIVDGAPSTSLDRAEPEALVRGLSALFRELPEIYQSGVEWRAGVVRTHYVNSEGTAFLRTTPEALLRVVASTQAVDGTPLEDSFTIYEASLGDLPRRDTLAARVRELGLRLTRSRRAPAADVYAGPVLFEGQAAAELFSQVFADRLAAARRPLSDNPMFEQFEAQAGDAFIDKIGARVLPRAFTVVANPTVTRYHGQFLGGYRVDDDGVPARETKLVDHGVLQTLLTTRVPVRGLLKSTGSRWGFGPVVSNLFVTTDSGLDDAALRRRLVSLAAARGKAYAVLVRRLANPADDPMGFMTAMASARGASPTLVRATVAVKLYPDGREESMRAADISGITLEAFKDIVAASSAPTVRSAPLGGGEDDDFESVRSIGRGFNLQMMGAPGYAASCVVPSLLFEDVSLKRSSGESPKLPVTSPPWAGGPRDR